MTFKLVNDIKSSIDLKKLPISKMILTKSRSAITLINLGLSQFKENALNRAKEFDLGLILPVYENFYKEVLSKKTAQKALV